MGNLSMFISRKTKDRLLELYLLIRCYKLLSKKPLTKTYISKFDGYIHHGGMADRFKGMVSVYAYCKCNKIEFKIDFTSPFNLTDYLLPNDYDWFILDKSRLSHNLFYSSPVCAIGDDNVMDILPFKKQCQLSIYTNMDRIDLINKKYNVNYKWGRLFCELFKPTELLNNKIISVKNDIGSAYNVAVFRFQQLLGDFSEKQFPVLSDSEQSKLISVCKRKLVDLQNKSSLPLLVTSDSYKFLDNIRNLKNIYIQKDYKRVHLDYTDKASSLLYMGAFVDFFLIASAEAVYSVCVGDMYPSEFPLYASKINNVPFYRIVIKNY